MEPFPSWGQFPEEEIARQIDVLLAAPIRLCRAFAPKMADRGSGGIVNVSSIAGMFPLPYMPLYNAAKAGLSAFSASLALEYKAVPFVTDFRLGDFRTNFNEAVKKESVLKMIPGKVKRGLKSRNSWIHLPTPSLPLVLCVEFYAVDKVA